MFCGIYCVLNSIACLLGWLVLIICTLKVIMGPSRVQELRNKIFAFIMATVMKNVLRKPAEEMKTELFSEIKKLKSVDPELQKNNALNILEVGVGIGKNLKFYPAGSRLTCVDPNKSFEAFFRRECVQQAAHLDPDILFVAEPGEDMASVRDGSVDVVVVTQVLCSVQSVERVLKEVLRVLVPGGKFFFLEHIGDTPGTWRRRLQDALSDSGLWPALFCHCVLTRNPEPALLKCGFSDVDFHTVKVLGDKVVPRASAVPFYSIANPFLYGVATK